VAGEFLGRYGADMTRQEAIQKVIDYILEHEKEPLVIHAFDGPTPMRGCLLMLEALGLVKFDDEPSVDNEPST
jgi:hypothetical protein